MSFERNKYPKVAISDVIREYLPVAKEKLGSLSFVFLSTVAVSVIGGIIVPLYYKQFFDLLTQNSDKTVIVPALLKILITILLLNIFNVSFYRLYTYFMIRFQTHVMARLRHIGFEYLLGHSYIYFSNNFTGSLTQKVNRFSRSFERITDRFFYEIIPILIKIIGISIVLWYVNPILTGIIFVWFVIYLIMSVYFARWKLPYDIKYAELESRATAALSDSVSNHTTIQLFNRYNLESLIFGVANTNHTKAMAKRWHISNVIDGVQAGLNIAIEFLIFFYAIKFWGLGMISVGAFVLIQMYIIGLMHDLWGSSRILRDLYESFADAKEMVEIMKLEHEIKDAPDALPIKVSTGRIDLNDVKFDFNKDIAVLNGIDLHIEAGERVALIGPSGAGKSTLVRLLLRMYDIKGGSIVIDGQNIKEITQGSLREAISFVPQDPILFHRSLKDNIRYGKTDATDEEVIEAAKLAHCHEFISSLPNGYDTFVGERGIKLSGGERQRVAIARAILKNAPILVLDEATSSLDSHSEILIQEALDILMKGKTVIVIAHRLSTIRKMNRIVVLENGNILEQGSHEDLLAKNGLYAKLWSLQSHGFIK
ncbi:MAG: ABC transporter ATP-binding protein [Candidatus Paceibacterota bacterium]|jgi:ATP-binding cassette subfamily B protein